mmetsp:Transcript_19845/g.40867  ORF Transcript_19845/g.40867 Transcript_19845/m.40867 type:complete len:209 (-) Transcript_19845:2230-2856(-)
MLPLLLLCLRRWRRVSCLRRVGLLWRRTMLLRLLMTMLLLLPLLMWIALVTLLLLVMILVRLLRRICTRGRSSPLLFFSHCFITTSTFCSGMLFSSSPALFLCLLLLLPGCLLLGISILSVLGFSLTSQLLLCGCSSTSLLCCRPSTLILRSCPSASIFFRSSASRFLFGKGCPLTGRFNFAPMALFYFLALLHFLFLLMPSSQFLAT